MKRSVFGVIVTNRSYFPAHLVGDARSQILSKLEELGYETVIVSETDTPMGAVQTFSDAQKCAALFRANRDRIDGIIIVMPNFGDEISVASAIDLAKLDVPVLIQACEDSL